MAPRALDPRRCSAATCSEPGWSGAAPRPAAAPAPAGRAAAHGRPSPGRRGRTPEQPRGLRTLVVTDGSLRGTTLTLGQAPVLIGRAPECTLVLDDDFASGRHARLFPQDGGWVVEDLGSTNGTFLGGVRVTEPTRVEPGVPVRVGRHRSRAAEVARAVAIALRYAARSDVGLVRQNNQDSGYAGPAPAGRRRRHGRARRRRRRLLARDRRARAPGRRVARLRRRCSRTSSAPSARPTANSSRGSRRSRTSPAWARRSPRCCAPATGSRWRTSATPAPTCSATATLTQITKDHTFVQTLVDEGRLTPEEAEHHPQRSVLMRVLTDIVDDPEPDFSIRESPGRRPLPALLGRAVRSGELRDPAGDPRRRAIRPGRRASGWSRWPARAGAPDNVTCIVADVVDEPASADAAPSVVGAASVRPPATSTGRGLRRGAGRRPHGGCRSGRGRRTPTRARPDRAVALSSGSPALRWSPPCSPRAASPLGTGSGSSTSWGSTVEQVAVYRGLPQDLGPLDLATLDHTTGVLVDTLPPADQDSVRAGLVVDNRDRGRGQGRSPPAGRCPRALPWRRDSRERLARPSPAVSPSVSPRSRPPPCCGRGAPSTTRGNTGAATPSSPSAAAVPVGQPRRRRHRQAPDDAPRVARARPVDARPGRGGGDGAS